MVNGTATVTVDDQNEPECSKLSSTLILGLKSVVIRPFNPPPASVEHISHSTHDFVCV